MQRRSCACVCRVLRRPHLDFRRHPAPYYVVISTHVDRAPTIGSSLPRRNDHPACPTQSVRETGKEGTERRCPKRKWCQKEGLATSPTAMQLKRTL